MAYVPILLILDCYVTSIIQFVVVVVGFFVLLYSVFSISFSQEEPIQNFSYLIRIKSLRCVVKLRPEPG